LKLKNPNHPLFQRGNSEEFERSAKDILRLSRSAPSSELPLRKAIVPPIPKQRRHGFLGANSEGVEVDGKDRTKYFQHGGEGGYVEVDEEQEAGNLFLQNKYNKNRTNVKSPPQKATVRFSEAEQKKDGPVMVDSEVQTMYRESDAQTDPWEPPYRLQNPDGPKPELLILAELGLRTGM
jgi:hypothetical protein